MPWTLLPAGTFNGLSDATVDAVLGTPRARYFISGDGHRTPPFAWAVRPAVRPYFQELMAAGNLCLHVEQHQEDVTDQSIPALFDPVFVQQQVFGWELDMFKHLLPVMNLIMEIMGSMPTPDLADVVTLHRHMIRMNDLAWKVGNPPWIFAALALSDGFLAYWKRRLDINPLNRIPAVGATEDGYLNFLNQYNNSCMALRCDANNFIAVNLMNAMARFPNATHLITVGNAHLVTNPVQQYINIGLNAGLIDPSQM